MECFEFLKKNGFKVYGFLKVCKNLEEIKNAIALYNRIFLRSDDCLRNYVREIFVVSVGENITDRFSLLELSNGAEFVPDHDDGVIIVKSGSGFINDIEVKKGDRLFFNAKDKVTLNGSADFVAVICF